MDLVKILLAAQKEWVNIAHNGDVITWKKERVQLEPIRDFFVFCFQKHKKI